VGAAEKEGVWWFARKVVKSQKPRETNLIRGCCRKRRRKHRGYIAEYYSSYYVYYYYTWFCCMHVAT